MLGRGGAARPRSRRKRDLPRTPSQTVGPYYAIGLCRRPESELDPRGIELGGRLLDGLGEPIPDGYIELWDPDGRRWGRSATHPDGRFSFRVPRDAARLEACVHARGLLRHQLTRIYLRDPGDAPPVLAAGNGGAARRRRARLRHPHAGRRRDDLLRAVTAFAGLFVPDALRAAVSDRAWLAAMLDAERALASASAAAGAIPPAAAAAIAAGCDAELYDTERLAAEGRAVANPAEPLVRALRAQVGEEHGQYVHRGATSQDLLDTAAMLVTRDALELSLAELDGAATACARLASEHRETPAAARTLLQQAVPTTFGYKAAVWLASLLDARVAFGRLTLPAQLGGAAGTLAAFGDRGPDVLARFAAELGLAEPLIPWHTLPDARGGARLCAHARRRCGGEDRAGHRAARADRGGRGARGSRRRLVDDAAQTEPGAGGPRTRLRPRRARADACSPTESTSTSAPRVRGRPSGRRSRRRWR